MRHIGDRRLQEGLLPIPVAFPAAEGASLTALRDHLPDAAFCP
jgi:hypothetical protein